MHVPVICYVEVFRLTNLFAFLQPKIPLNQFYPYIRCGLCCGFLIDASTITECLHTCKTWKMSIRTILRLLQQPSFQKCFFNSWNNCVYLSDSLQKLRREALFLQQQMSHVQHRGPRDTTPLQHQVWLISLRFLIYRKLTALLNNR